MAEYLMLMQRTWVQFPAITWKLITILSVLKDKVAPVGIRLHMLHAGKHSYIKLNKSLKIDSFKNSYWTNGDSSWCLLMAYLCTPSFTFFFNREHHYGILIFIGISKRSKSELTIFILMYTCMYICL